ncbi:hypothetical protein A3844_07905 [Paenibacillus helianthi]|uniref:Uncharacterized protein n=1 Tax=Paenibacillus helianthi TaxID=1349432 RepID=A0ABX3EV00_9BACL|nr:hypothetical protein [Paenibacillus helianthi]OKP88289.1 hypothetical protein A3844_07905 [Paenibacillus helianthi]
MNQLQVYEAPKDIPGRQDYQVKVRNPGEAWQTLFIYEVKVDMHEVRPASMAFFDFEGEADVEITCLYTRIEGGDQRPRYYILCFPRWRSVDRDVHAA